MLSLPLHNVHSRVVFPVRIRALLNKKSAKVDATVIHCKLWEVSTFEPSIRTTARLRGLNHIPDELAARINEGSS